jgi:hypothetical protein
LVDAADLKSAGINLPCRFKSGPGHQLFHPLQHSGAVYLFSGEDIGNAGWINE